MTEHPTLPISACVLLTGNCILHMGNGLGEGVRIIYGVRVLCGVIRYVYVCHSENLIAKGLCLSCTMLLTLHYFLAVQYDEHLTQLEKDIKAAQEAALDAVETDSIFTGTSVDQGDMSKSHYNQQQQQQQENSLLVQINL